MWTLVGCSPGVSYRVSDFFVEEGALDQNPLRSCFLPKQSPGGSYNLCLTYSKVREKLVPKNMLWKKANLSIS